MRATHERARVQSLEARRLFSVPSIGPGISDVNLTRMPGEQSTEVIAVDPAAPDHVFALSNNQGNGLAAAGSDDGGATWTSAVIANGSDPLPPAWSDPAVAYDTFGNLFIAYLCATPANANTTGRPIEVALSIDLGKTFVGLRTFDGPLDRPNLAAGAGAAWLSYTRFASFGGSGAPMVSGVAVRGLGKIGSFSLPRVVARRNDIAGVTGISIGLRGQVLLTYQLDSPQGPTTLFIAQDPAGLAAPGAWRSKPIVVTDVGTFYPIPAQARRTIDPAAAVAFDDSGGPFTGREYFAYVDAPHLGNPSDTDVFLRYSENGGRTWSAPMRVNDDATSASQFMPRLAVDPVSGEIAVGWYDCRNSPDNQDVQYFATVGTPVAGGVAFSQNVQVSTGSSNSSATHASDDPNQFGDWSGLAFYNYSLYPAWADDSNSTGDNPDPGRFDVYSAKLAILSGGDPPVDPAGPSVVAAVKLVSSRSPVAGDTGILGFSIFNGGPGELLGPVEISFDLKSDGGLIALGNVVKRIRLRPGRYVGYLQRFTYPFGLVSGDYRPLVTVDPTGIIAESNYANKTAADPIPVGVTAQ